MNPKTEKWIPEVGQPCQVKYGHIYPQKEGLLLDVLAVTEEHLIGVNERGREVPFSLTDPHINFRPIQTQADKVRDEQIEKLEDAVFMLCPVGLDCNEPKTFAEDLYSKGVRVLAPDERICKPLSDEQIVDILTVNLGLVSQHQFYDVIDAVQRELGLIEG